MSYDVDDPMAPKPPPERPTKERTEYPRCPRCAGPVVGAMMTSSSVVVAGVRYYAPSALSVHCASSACNYDKPLSDLKTPARVPADE